METDLLAFTGSVRGFRRISISTYFTMPTVREYLRQNEDLSRTRYVRFEIKNQFFSGTNLTLLVKSIHSDDHRDTTSG